jgi:hypothetical protein
MIDSSPGGQIYLANGVPIVLVNCWPCLPKQDQNKTKTRLPGCLSQILITKRAKNQIFIAQNLLKTPETSSERLNFILDHSELFSQVRDLQNSNCCCHSAPACDISVQVPTQHNTIACSCIVFVVFTDYSGNSDSHQGSKNFHLHHHDLLLFLNYRSGNHVIHLHSIAD